MLGPTLKFPLQASGKVMTRLVALPVFQLVLQFQKLVLGTRECLAL